MVSVVRGARRYCSSSVVLCDGVQVLAWFSLATEQTSDTSSKLVTPL